jgi:hypothetical protein
MWTVQEYCNQMMAFADGIAMCYLLNATCVLPKWYRCEGLLLRPGAPIMPAV